MTNKSAPIFIIFGASGDLTRRKLLPALYRLYKRNLISAQSPIIGVGKTELSDENFREIFRQAIQTAESEDDKKTIDPLIANSWYQSVNTRDISSFAVLKERITEIQKMYQISGEILYYLATPPKGYATVAQGLKHFGLLDQTGSWKRMIVEKPFGFDLDSARKLNADLHQCMDENQIYRIDHYLGKETVQNILVTRFANGIYEPLWNRNFISHVEITASEAVGIGTRAGYYETIGAMRDMMQNHLFHILGMIAMEPPAILDADAIRNEVLKVFQSMRRMKEEHLTKSLILGQYTASHIRGETVCSYREEEGVPPDSKTETFAALKLFVNNWRWGGVPFFLRTGKAMPTRVTEVVIHFKQTPCQLFKKPGDAYKGNQMIIRIQPDEGLLLKFDMKIPGFGYRLKPVDMSFHYSNLEDNYIPEAYERLIYDCITGDATLFARSDGVEESWKMMGSITDAIDQVSPPLYGYPAGTWGPAPSSSMLEGYAADWRHPCKNLSNDGIFCEL